MHHTLRRPGAAVALALTLIACSDPGQTLDTIPPTLSTAAPATTAEVSASTTPTSARATTVADTPTTVPPPTTEVSTANTLALTDGPWTVVASIPEVTEPGLYYELSLPGLYAYFPEKVADDDPVFWTMNETDRPIIEAYLNAQLTINQAMLTRPMDFNLAGWDLYFEDGGAAMQRLVQSRNDAGWVLDIGPGYVMRPWVIEDGRSSTEATLVDCQKIGSVLRTSDGSLAPGSAEGWGDHGLSVSMVLRDGEWVVRRVSEWGDACTAFGPSSS